MSDDSGDSEAQTSSTANLAEGEGDGKQGSKKKLIRLLTVMAYVSSVSGTAFMLSMYYLFLWEPKVAEHHLKGDAMGHQALALKGHVDHGQRGMYDGIYDGYPLPGVMYRPPVGSSSPGSYRSAATPMGPPMGPPLGTPGRPVSRYDYQYQDSVPMWVHSSYAQQPPHPPSLSQVREPSDPLFMTKLTTLARSPRAHPSTPPPQPTLATTSSPARNSATQVVMIRTTTASPQTNIALADIRPSSPWTLTPSAAPLASSSPEPPIVLTTERVSAPTSTSPVTSTPASAATSAPTSTLVTTPLPRRAPPNLTARKQPLILPPRSATASPWVARLPPVVQETTPAHPPVTKSPRKVVDAKKTPPLLSPGAPATKVQPPAALAAPAAVPTPLLLSAKHTVMAAAREASLVLSHQDAPRA